MTRVPLDIPAGLNGDDTTFAAAGRWASASGMRWRLGRPQVRGGCERLTETALTGICRTIFNWSDTAGNSNVAFGTHTKLQVWLGGELFDITPSSGFTPGVVDGTGGTGYGTGAYSTGEYSEPSTEDYFPLTWSLAAWGENLLANPRGQTIFAWDNATGTPAAAVTGAPAEVTAMLVSPTDQVFALGCNQEVSGVFNPRCIRHSSVRDREVWTTGAATTAREYILPGGGRIVGGRVIGESLLVWTNIGLFLGTFVGSLTQPWRFDLVAEKCGLIGPNAAVVVGLRAFWIGPDLQVYAYSLGGGVSAVECPILQAFVENMAASQGDKIVASSTSTFQEIRFDYPDARDGTENSRYLTLIIGGSDTGSWAQGEEARTAYLDAGPSGYPIAADPDGRALWQERGQSNDGGPLAWFIETADQYLDENTTMMARALWPDASEQVGAVDVTIYTRLTPQGDVTTKGPYAMAPGAGKVDIRATGRLFRVRFEGNSTPASCRFGKPVFDLVAAGQR